jgi:hypothetical protein
LAFSDELNEIMPEKACNKIFVRYISMPDTQASFAGTFRFLLRKILHDMEEYAVVLSLTDPANSADLIEQLQMGLDQREHSLSSLSQCLHLRMTTVKRRFEMAGYPLNVRQGRLPNHDMKEVQKQINYLQQVEGIHRGEKRTAESIVDSDENPPYLTIRRLMSPSRIPKPKLMKHPHRFEAKYRDYIWHSDLHQLPGPAHVP